MKAAVLIRIVLFSGVVILLVLTSVGMLYLDHLASIAFPWSAP